MTQMASQIKSVLRGGVSRESGGASYHGGISYNAATGQVVLKAPGASPSVVPLTTAFTFTGGNQSMYRAPNGLLVQSVTNTPRIEYDANGNCLGLLMEASKTNLALHSGDHTNVAWVKTTMTTAKTSTGPDGVTNSATRLTATGANSTSLQTVVSASATRAYSPWMRRITGTGNVDLTLDNGVGWATQTLTSSWTRFPITQAAVTNPVFGVRLVTNGDAIDIYGDQLESAAFASSLIPTTTIAVARTADSCIRTLGAEFSATAGTVVVRGRTGGGAEASVAQSVWAISDGGTNERFNLVRVAAATSLDHRVVDGGVLQNTGTDVVITNSTAFKSAMAWASNDLAASFNGAAVLADASITLPTVTQCEIGSVAGVSQGNGHILTFDYYPTRQSNAFLQLMSA